MPKREYPELPLVGVGGVVISGERALLVRRGTEPARGEWTIPGGLLEAGETLAEGVARELLEETALTVRVVELIEATERIFFDALPPAPLPRDPAPPPAKPRYHYVILDYLCELIEGEPRANDEISHFAFVPEADLDRYALTPAAARIAAQSLSPWRRIARTAPD